MKKLFFTVCYRLLFMKFSNYLELDECVWGHWKTLETPISWHHCEAKRCPPSWSNIHGQWLCSEGIIWGKPFKENSHLSYMFSLNILLWGRDVAKFIRKFSSTQRYCKQGFQSRFSLTQLLTYFFKDALDIVGGVFMGLHADFKIRRLVHSHFTTKINRLNQLWKPS